MKTSRQILLEEFGAADAKLAAIQQSVLKSAFSQRAPQARERVRTPFHFRRWLGETAHLFWTEVILVARPVWAGYAVIWAVIIAVNMAEQSGEPRMAKTSPATESQIIAWREQRNILAEFSMPAPSEPADRVRPAAPQPRSEAQQRWTIV